MEGPVWWMALFSFTCCGNTIIVNYFGCNNHAMEISYCDLRAGDDPYSPFYYFQKNFWKFLCSKENKKFIAVVFTLLKSQFIYRRYVLDPNSGSFLYCLLNMHSSFFWFLFFCCRPYLQGPGLFKDYVLNQQEANVYN